MAVQIVARTLLPLQSVKSDGAPVTVAQALKDANRAIYERMLAEVDKQDWAVGYDMMNEKYPDK